jgi:hypothetical protein
MPDLQAAALRYAKHGFPIFPVHTPDGDRCSCRRPDCSRPGKHPRSKNGLHDATIDPKTIEKWWSIFPDANIGARTGRESAVVLDIDGQHGADSLHELERQHGQLPRTATVKTPRGGEHFFFKHPAVEVRNSTSTLAPGIDIRGDGGYVLLPPSIGPSGRRYEVDERAPLAALPGWLLELTATKTGPHRAAPPGEWLTIVRDGVNEGSRNQQLARLIGHLLRRYVDVDLAGELAHLVNEKRFRPPLDREDVDGIIDSIAKCEIRRRGQPS